MKKLLLAAAVSTMSLSASAFELDDLGVNFDDSYVTLNSILKSEITDNGGPESIGHGIGYSMAVDGIDMPDETSLYLDAGYNRLINGKIGLFDVEVNSIYVAPKVAYEVADDIEVQGKVGLNFLSGSGDSEVKLHWGVGGRYNYTDELSVGLEYVKSASNLASFIAVVGIKI